MIQFVLLKSYIHYWFHPLFPSPPPRYPLLNFPSSLTVRPSKQSNYASSVDAAITILVYSFVPICPFHEVAHLIFPFFNQATTRSHLTLTLNANDIYRMDISDNAYLSASGCSLNTSERAGLEAAILAQRAAKVKEPQFWGKIEGTGGDYLITQSIVEGFSAVPTKKFYYT